MPERFTLGHAIIATATISVLNAVFARQAILKERDARQRLAAELSATEFQRKILAEIVCNRGPLTKEEAAKLCVYPLPE